MKSCVIEFDATGVGHCLYTEAVKLSAIGHLSMQRASTIKFSQAKQVWEVRGANQKLLYSHPSRNACLDWEQHYFNQ